MTPLEILNQLNSIIEGADASALADPQTVQSIANTFSGAVKLTLNNPSVLSQNFQDYVQAITNFSNLSDPFSTITENELIGTSFNKMMDLLSKSGPSENGEQPSDEQPQSPEPQDQPPTPPAPPAAPDRDAPQPPPPPPTPPAPPKPPGSPTNVPSDSKSQKPAPSSNSSKEPSDSEESLFRKFHGTSFDPKSSMDKRKMEMLRQAEKEVGSKDESKLRQAAYALQYGGKQPSSSSKTTSKSPTVKFGDTQQPTYIQVAGGKFVPASNKDVAAGNQIWIKNPRKGQGETHKPNYVQVRTEKGESLRPKSQLPGTLGSLSNFLGDVGNTLDKTSRKPRR